MITIAEVEADLKAAILSLDKAMGSLALLRQMVEQAQLTLLNAVVASQPLRVGDLIERTWVGKIQRVKIAGFRHRWGNHLGMSAHFIKKDGSVSTVLREFYETDGWTKVS